MGQRVTDMNPLPSASISLREGVPAPEDIREFVERLGAGPSTLVPVQPAPGAEPGWCYRNVAREVVRHGGQPLHCWLMWASPLFATAEYHVVHRRADGSLSDVTPKVDGEKQVLIAVDPSRPADFDFMQRPPNQRIRLYRGLSAERRAEDLIGCMRPAERDFAVRRAERAGMSLLDHVASRMGPDRLEVAIDKFLAVCGEAESLLRPTPEGQFCEDIPRLRALEGLKGDLFARLSRAWEVHPANRLGFEPTGEAPRP